MSFLELADVVRRTSLSRPTIYRKMRAGAFPQKRKISERRVAWLEEEIDEWIKNKSQQ
ncbi:AlpA family phage regulatory protein [Salmonella enterica subsp. enterica serovar Muenchen]|nr:AlpA family phage regulatory protein [Salmonella enterica subsp. enterica serovar Muenchen]EDQ3992099.1 AlpA family phage regulatory protein [Salmonella enterica subsp. enterica]EBW7189430.1 transcriptional regulator [Salmonella enterica subsp. enterica serovar Muenchen]EBX4462893.1 transcriptional regulator [Salmonella enterica subsp. enterica serovar Muenchen]EBY3554595.1 AlpA family phage regulatory protein [Salmonella enterica subsp. enterica serovar Muenchen]